MCIKIACTVHNSDSLLGRSKEISSSANHTGTTVSCMSQLISLCVAIQVSYIMCTHKKYCIENKHSTCPDYLPYKNCIQEMISAKDEEQSR